MSGDIDNHDKPEATLDETADSATDQKQRATAADDVEPAADTEQNEVPEQGGKADGELLKLAEENAGLKDQLLRERAEMQNVRKRVQRDVENARKFALEKFVSELLPVIDNLERAVEASAGDQAVREGVELTLKSFLNTLEKFHVKVVDPLGEPFDVNFHQAMTMVDNKDMEPNTVMDVMQKGYTLNDRLVRPAMVVVSK